jgi:hypothetical protein
VPGRMLSGRASLPLLLALACGLGVESFMPMQRAASATRLQALASKVSAYPRDEKGFLCSPCSSISMKARSSVCQAIDPGARISSKSALRGVACMRRAGAVTT